MIYYGDPMLRDKSSYVESVDDKITGICNELIAGVLEYKAYGLAAPQIGYSLQIFAYTPDPKSIPPVCLINPEIVEKKGEQFQTERCLSFPGIIARVRRPLQIQFRARNMDWQERLGFVTGLEAQIICHEVDHLDGVLFVDHFDHFYKMITKKKLSLLKKRINRQ